MATIKKLYTNTLDPKFLKPYAKYDKITKEHCNELIEHLYSGNKAPWINPFTQRPLTRTSNILMVFLAKCHSVWGDIIVNIGPYNISYKEHVEKIVEIKRISKSAINKLNAQKSLRPGVVPLSSFPGYVATPSNSSSSSSSASPPGAAGPIMHRVIQPRPVSPPGAANAARIRFRGTPSNSSSSGSASPSAAGPVMHRVLQPRHISPPGAARQTAPPGAARQTAPPGAAHTKKSNSPARSKSPARAAHTKKSKSPARAAHTKKSNSPARAAQNKPAQGAPIQALPQASPQALPQALQMPPAPQPKPHSIKTLTFRPSTSLNKNAEYLTEKICLDFVKDIKEKLSKTSPENLKDLTFYNPITKKDLGINSTVLQSYLSKCYYKFQHPEIQSTIEELVDINNLIDLGKKTAVSKKDADALTVDNYIETCKTDFITCCDELIANCDANGILNKYEYISKIVNSIMAIIHVKLMHLNKLYDKLKIKDYRPFQIFMYDELFKNFMGVDAEKKFKDNYNILGNTINETNTIYQNNKLLESIDNNKTEMRPKTTEKYHINTLYNRQYVFEFLDTQLSNFILFNRVNRINYKDTSKTSALDVSLRLAKQEFDLHLKNNLASPFNYNITNSVLPKYIFCNTKDEIAIYFEDIITFVNAKLQTLPTINGIKEEASEHEYFYNIVIGTMEKYSFGDNETDYGGKDMIRKNILYALNAQSAFYIYNNSTKAYDDIYYNYEFSGTFPLFTWVPLNNSSKYTIYNYPNAVNWQPLDMPPPVVQYLELSYKNHGISPYSKWLNETIFKVITDEYASINSLIHADRITAMRTRVQNTLGIYKNLVLKEGYKNKKIYLFHGTRTRLHSIGGKEKDIEILGFLSTSLNMYTASYYSGIETTGTGIIYIIEVDSDQTYINLNDNLLQFLLLPNSRLRVIHEFNYGPICVILCRLFRTPSVASNIKLYNKILNINPPTSKDMNTYVSYRIKTYKNDMPRCAFIFADLWKKYKIHDEDEGEFEVYKIKRDKLNNKALNNTSMSQDKLQEQFIYFSLGQEYEIYVDRGLPLILGNFEDIKYSLHQHFIKDCYKSLEIPCIDYAFVHSIKVDNAIATCIPLKEYRNNRINHSKYDINNFLIDCIFNFDSFKNENRTLVIPIVHHDAFSDKVYADKIETFKDAGIYYNGEINLTFNQDKKFGMHIQFMRRWPHVFAKYRDATDEQLSSHFAWCNDQILKLIGIITATKYKYIHFIENALNGTIKDKKIDKQGSLDKLSKESIQLIAMIENLTDIVSKRARFYGYSTMKDQNTNPAFGNNTGGYSAFISMIKKLLAEEPLKIHIPEIYQNPILADLILKKEKSDSLVGGIHSMSEIKKMNMQIMQPKSAIDHEQLYETFKNIPIQESKDMRKFKDMPKSFQEYYKGAILDKDGCFDISDHCYCRTI